MRIVLIFLFTTLFAANLDQRVAKLEKEVKELKSKIDKLLNAQTNIETTIKKSSLSSCNYIQIVKFDYIYHNGFFENYDLFYTIKNNYNKTISYLKANIVIKDKDDNTLIEDFIKRDITLSSQKTSILKTNYKIDSEVGLSSYLRTTPKKELLIQLRPIVVKFSDGEVIKCNN
jgi:hypothetical protein